MRIHEKEDAIIDLQNLKLSYANDTWNQHHFETFDIAIACIQHCIDEENNAEFTSPYTPNIKEHIISSYDKKYKIKVGI